MLPVKPPAEPAPDPAGFLESYPQEASAASRPRQLTEGPRFVIDVVEVAARERPESPAFRPKVAVFQSESIDPRTFAAAVQVPGKFGFKFAPGMPSRDVFTMQGQPNFRPEKFLNGFLRAQEIPGLSRSVASEPVWRSFEPFLPSRLDGGIVLVTGSFLRWPVIPAVEQDVVPESFEIKLQPISFPPFPPRMACLEERLHRTDRIGFSPP